MFSRREKTTCGKKTAKKKKKLKIRALRHRSPNGVRCLENEVLEVDDNGMVVATIK
jgi:hypothetical protein